MTSREMHATPFLFIVPTRTIKENGRVCIIYDPEDLKDVAAMATAADDAVLAEKGMAVTVGED